MVADVVVHHGLAASIRGCTESETFDLGNQTVSGVTAAIEAAFASPLSLEEEMIRITLIVGAGKKQSRQKYPEGLVKAVTLALQRLGYIEDRAASCVMECAGTFKLQHDTGKNLKTVVVFPKISNIETDHETRENNNVDSIVPEDSPGYKIMVSSMKVFQNMIARQCPSWSQKKGCLGAIEALKGLLADMDSKLMRGTALDDAEQVFYDQVCHLDEKEAWVRQELSRHVEEGQITRFERDLLLQHNAERMETLQKENKATDKALQRKELLESIDAPVPPHELRYHAEIRALRKELVPLLELESKAKGRLLSVKETQTLARKDEILEEIEHLEQASRGWFEDDDAFASRLEASRRAFATRSGHRGAANGNKNNKVATIGSDTKVKVPVSKWVTPAESRGWTMPSGKKKGKVRGGDVFLAMMVDSDDDDDEEDGDDDEKEERADEDEDVHDTPATATTAPSSSPAKKKSKRKRKKKSGSRHDTASGEDDDDDNAVLERALPKPSNDQETALSRTVSLVQTYILPLLVAVLGWLLGLVFGKPKKKRKQK